MPGWDVLRDKDYCRSRIDYCRSCIGKDGFKKSTPSPVEERAFAKKIYEKMGSDENVSAYVNTSTPCHFDYQEIVPRHMTFGTASSLLDWMPRSPHGVGFSPCVRMGTYLCGMQGKGTQCLIQLGVSRMGSPPNQTNTPL